MSDRNHNLYVVAIQVLFGLSVFLLFCVAFFFLAGKNAESMGPIVVTTAKAAILPVTIYFLNYSFLVPRMFFRGRKLMFFTVDVVIMLLAAILPFVFIPDSQIEEVRQLEPELGGISLGGLFLGALIIRIMLYAFMIALAIGMRFITRWYEEKKKLEEERRRNTEAELKWLKNQLNPHFLFNTLNNISSLVQIDADKAQDSIAQLSDLLRYALYETNNQKVRVVDEVAFMGNYIALMKLRCSEKTVVDVRFDEFDRSLRISPLLFISLVENAFKHGTSAHHDAFLRIDMGLDGPDLVFSCENSLISKETKNYSGSGVGVENLRRRLELLYQGEYSYESFVEDDKYVAIVRIRNIGYHGQDEMYHS